MIEIRSPGPQDVPGLDALYHEAFGYTPPRGFWAWKYGQAPGPVRQRVALDPGGRLVAHAGSVGLPAKWAGGRGVVSQMVDFMGTTGGGGLRSALVETVRSLFVDLPSASDVPWIFGFPSERHLRLGRTAIGYVVLGQADPWSGPLPDTASAAGSGSRVELEISESCGDWAESIWRACGLCSIERSATFLNWRYYARPERYYRFYRLSVDGISGLAVFGYAGEEARAAELWLPAGPDWAAALPAVVPDLRAMGTTRWTFWPVDDSQRALLGALGARSTGVPVVIGGRGRPGGPEPVGAGAGFLYAMGDYDLV